MQYSVVRGLFQNVSPAQEATRIFFWKKRPWRHANIPTKKQLAALLTSFIYFNITLGNVDFQLKFSRTLARSPGDTLGTPQLKAQMLKRLNAVTARHWHARCTYTHSGTDLRARL